ncbi:hypothetical protein Ait01nite_034060 [Actinoplanes italicus]|nr:hypothetical protein Ait01nite_034060 [Actinoplanes italicus]
MTVTAVTVSWFGVRLGVAPALTDEPPVAIDVNRRYTEIRFGLDETLPPTTAPPSPSASPSKARPSKRPAPSRTAGRPSATPTTAAPASVAPSPSPTQDNRPRYRVTADGGAIIVAYSSTRVDIVDAEPRSGYVASAARRSDTAIVARLTGPGHTSVITAYWSGGPAAQVIEDYGF